MSEMVKLVAVVLLMAVLCGCDPTEQSSANATVASPSLRRIILFNEDGKTSVGLMKDTEGLTVFVNMLKSPSAETQAQFKAAQVDGKIFQVDSGTRAEILKEVPISGVPGMTIMRIRISNGPRETEEALCFSTSTQPDNSR